MVGTRGDDDPHAVVDAFRAGSERALAEAYARWSPMVYSIALRSLGEVADAEVVTQRVFIRAWNARDTLDPGHDQLAGWLIDLTRSTVAEVQPGRSAAAPPPATATTTTRTDETIDPADLAQRLMLADEVSRLDATPQQVLRMALNGELTHTQIGERMGLPADAVKGHIRRGLLRLRQRLEVQTDAH